MILIRGLGVTIPSYNDLKDVELELMRRSDEIQNSCKLLLFPLLDGIDFGHNYLNHWMLSMDDIKCGYSELEEILKYNTQGFPQIFGRRFILLIRDYKDPNLGNFYAGELIDWVKASHFVDEIPKQSDKVNGLYDALLHSYMVASNYRTSKTLSK
jgi:hypothetical protein